MVSTFKILFLWENYSALITGSTASTRGKKGDDYGSNNDSGSGSGDGNDSDDGNDDDNVGEGEEGSVEKF
jgi:hypothetical protein